MAEDKLDLLPPLPDIPKHPYSPTTTHVCTYTAGEDSGRLAEMAKQFGLENARAPKKQVRRISRSASYLRGTRDIVRVLLDYTMLEDARMRSIYSSRFRLEDDEAEEEKKMYLRLRENWDTTTFDSGEAPEGGEAIDPHTHGMGSNLTAAVLGIIKGMVGPAILYLPHGLATAGYAVALPIMAAATVLFLYSSNCLLDAWKHEAGVGGADESSTDSERLELASRRRGPEDYGGIEKGRPVKRGHPPMLSYPELAYRASGTTGESIVKTGIALMQSGVCLTYLIFVPQNLHSSMRVLFGWDISPSYWLILMVVIQIPLSWIRDVRKFTWTNLLANVLILYGLLVCLAFAVSIATSGDTEEGPVEVILERMSNLEPFAKNWYLFIGTSVLLFEGAITLLVPLQEAVKGKEDRAKFQSVNQNVILGIICFYAFFGITCLMGFGTDVRTILTVSLPVGYLATSVQFAYSVAVIFTFPLQNFPALEIACRSISSMLRNTLTSGEKPPWTGRNFISSVLVCLLAVVAVATMDSLDKVVSLMGSLLGCPIAFVFPPLIHTRIDPNLPTSRKITNYLVAGIGLLAMGAASFTTIYTWND